MLQLGLHFSSRHQEVEEADEEEEKRGEKSQCISDLRPKPGFLQYTTCGWGESDHLASAGFKERVFPDDEHLQKIANI